MCSSCCSHHHSHICRHSQRPPCPCEPWYTSARPPLAVHRAEPHLQVVVRASRDSVRPWPHRPPQRSWARRLVRAVANRGDRAHAMSGTPLARSDERWLGRRLPHRSSRRGGAATVTPGNCWASRGCSGSRVELQAPWVAWAAGSHGAALRLGHMSWSARRVFGHGVINARCVGATPDVLGLCSPRST